MTTLTGNLIPTATWVGLVALAAVFASDFGTKQPARHHVAKDALAIAIYD